MAKIECPNKAYSGISAGIKFVDGAAETDDKNAVSWFKKHGYIVDGHDYGGRKAQEKGGSDEKVSKEEYERLLNEHKQLMAACEEKDKEIAELNEHKDTSLSDDSLLPILKEYAILKEIDIGQASTVKGIFKKIEDAQGEDGQ